jgi:phosphopantothenoylcysteine decarboxylase / phosphopantothenate---cysteine ligase
MLLFPLLTYCPSSVAAVAHLFNRNVVLGVSGGIAAYKSAELVRQLKELGADVRVIMTRGAREFITPLTLQALSGRPVHTELLDTEAELGMGHIELARWADLLLIAPATADLLARLAAGRADDLLTTVALATAAPKLLAPAMNQQMWRDPATTANVATLAERGFRMVGPADGEQACGDVGPGRMEQPAAIAQAAAALFRSGLLAGRRVVITAGPTREALDPVRYLSNHSSGKMGYALAQAAADAGARTTLVSGPVHLATPDHVRRIDVQSAEDMLRECLALTAECDIFIACAAVADYRPATPADQKIKKGAATVTLELQRNPDILATVSAAAGAPFTVGFAAETTDVLTYARGKLESKGLDMIVANDVSNAAIGFNSEQNAVTVLWHNGSRVLEQASKAAIARDLIALIAARLDAADD